MTETKQKQLDVYQSQIKQTQDDLVVAYMPALKALAFKLKSRLPSSVDVNDLISIGATAMVKLSRTYDKEQNDNFWGYARQRVYGAMLDYLRGLDTLSRSNRDLVKQINNIIDKYFMSHGEEPDDAYIAKELNEDENKIREARNLGDIIAILPISEQFELIGSNNVEFQVEQDDLIDKITQILKDMNEKEQTIIQLYYFEELTLKEISDVMNITESRISQIHKKLIIKLRERLGFNG